MRLDIAYDGSGFAGWARQPELRTVQGVLEDALGTLLRRAVPLTVAGRTDAGVHATGQVAHLDLDVDDPGPDELARRLGRMLPADVRVPTARPVPPEFDARFAALRRHYRYRVGDAPWGVAPLHRHDTLHWHRPLDVDAMNAASTRMLGEHDFAAFCKRRESATTVRALQRLFWSRDGDLVCAEVAADAFCHSMVRSLVGALLAVGDGRRGVDWPVRLLDLRTRSSEVGVVAPHGLCLVAVDYPPDSELAARADLTRAVRAPLSPR